ncbi:energy transducer TonB [Parabacteroides chongii]|uniref:energy transducer TonB n=1 Tax=Parabacteroides chongii TaxID=2685834 RepID=UPI00240E2005|nr:energy transducer TonB [Parabacteroides chongii]WFE82693.1 energy transducer TonB [Parabacteroides chongii]
MRNLLQYIQGSRKGKEAHRLEKEAMKDPFLADALDGFQTVEGNHVESIEAMRRRISRRTRSQRDQIAKWSIAASLLICLGFGSYFWFNRDAAMPKELQSMVIQEKAVTPPPPPEPAIAQAAVTPELQEETEAMQKQAPVAAKKPEARMRQVTPTPAPLAAAPARAEVLSIVEDDANVAEMIVAEEEVAMDATMARASIHRPEPVIGYKAYEEYLRKELIHPQDSTCKGVTGTVVVAFHINEKGRPVDLEVKRSLCASADKEALRLIEKGPDWKVDTTQVIVPVLFAP